jgi:ABC-type transport system involved in multi-copper enzyme maturation permease subunit
MNATFAIAGATFGEAVRKRILMVILLVALLIILISPAFEPFAAGRGARTLIISFGFGVIQLAGTFIAIIMCTGMIPTEIERRTIYTILSKPVQRYQFVLGKFFGAVGTLAFMYLMMGIVFLIASRMALGAIRSEDCSRAADVLLPEFTAGGGCAVFLHVRLAAGELLPVGRRVPDGQPAE